MKEPDTTTNQPGEMADPGNEIVPPVDSAAELASILDRYLAELQAGHAPDREQLFLAHPELVAQLEACLAGIEFIHRATGPVTEAPPTLGEFRIIRELGRGGMGVVYEAEQTTLGRHVALKVLRFTAVADEEAMRRFQREAETVARLHHTNIVPIFAVGCEQGVHYYAMQFIAGRSLADVLAESQRTTHPVPVEDIARWGLQAAEALAHAHQRGVIHRDIKPSNLLLDHDGIVWLTDFGLAKRMDEATLTVHGTLMGTPRYMSPEQAASLQQPVDSRTDIYSLGATLYELATGQPLFGSAMPQLVIAQILTEEPARPRQIRSALPRDLETVILTCLAKEPLKRYQSAQALARDLRAVIEGRPIQARKTPAVERIVRYVRQRRKTLTGTGIAAAATVLLMVGALLGWRYYADWRLGRVALTTDGPPLAAEILPESSNDRPIGEPFDIGARTVVALPAGDYRLRVKAKGLMSQTYRFAINRGETMTHHLTLDENRLLSGESIPFSPVMETVMLKPGKTNFIEWNGETLIRRDGSSGKPIWDAARPVRPWSPERDPAAALRRLSHFGDEKRPGELVQPAPDLDGDGTADWVWAIRGTPSLLALSGKDGSVLWAYSADPGEPGEPRLADDGRRPGRVAGAPAMVDVDGDGITDLVAEFVVLDDPQGQCLGSGTIIKSRQLFASRHSQAARVARSGRRQPCQIGTRVESVSQAFWASTQPHVKAGIVPTFSCCTITSGGGGTMPPLTIDTRTRLARLSGQDGRVIWDVLVANYTGGLFWHSDNFVHEFADLHGDGSLEMVLLLNFTARSGTTPFELRVLSLATGDTRWSHLLNPGAIGAASFLAGDLDGDGSAEVVVSEQPLVLTEAMTELTALDGASGKPRWTWRGTPAPEVSDQKPKLCLADFDKTGRHEVCVSYGVAPGRRRVEILDSHGRSRVGRDLESDDPGTLISKDLDGDGRDELLVHSAGRLCALRRDLTEVWSWPTREPIREVLPASPGKSATVVIGTSLGLDGATGRRRWLIGPARSILSVNDGKSSPLALTGPDGTTVCRVAMSITAEGTYSPAQGEPAKAASSGDDPRWERPLPWVSPVEPYANPLVQIMVAATLINVCIPVGILWMATRRRFWSMRLLLALPVVVAILLTGYSALISIILDQPQMTVPRGLGVFLGVVLLTMGGVPIVAYVTAFVLSLVRLRWLKLVLVLPIVAAILIAGSSVLDRLIPTRPQPTAPSWWSTPLDVAMLSMSGLPIVAYAAVLVLSPVRRRWRAARLFIGGTVLVAILIWAITLLSGTLAKPRIEHFNWSGWHQAVYVGVYAVGVLALLARPARGVARFVWRLIRRPPSVISSSSGMQ